MVRPILAAGGQSTTGAALLGSVSSTLIRDARCPVVVVPPSTVAPLDAEGMSSVVCGVAGEETDALLRESAPHRLGLAFPTQLAAQGRTAVVVVPPGTTLEPGSGHYELVAGRA